MKFTEATFRDALHTLLEDAELEGYATAENGDTGEYEDQTAEGTVERAYSFEDAGLLTRNEGLVVRLDDGTEFQVTVVESTR